MNKKIFLTVTAHPDDEVLGFGGSSAVLTNRGHQVFNLILSGNVDARAQRPEISDLNKHIFKAQKIIGAEPAILGPFPNIMFNCVPHLEIVQFIEQYILQIQPDIVVTHHPYDLNNDHYHTSKACQAAFRLFQRKPIKKLTALYFMEVPSSTDWSFPVDGQQFRPDTFIEIGEEGLQRKIEALSAYEGVMRSYPHPRSVEALQSLAILRGSQVGRNMCESFQTAMNIIDL